MEKITLAQMLKPQGIKGEMKFKLLTQSLDDIKNASTLYLNNELVSIEGIRETNGFVYIKFNEITSISVAERFRDAQLFASKEELLNNLEEGEYFIADLIDKQIVFESGEVLGTLADVQNFGSADVFYVNKPNGKEVLFSNVEGVIIKVDEEKITINEEKFNQVSV